MIKNVIKSLKNSPVPETIISQIIKKSPINDAILEKKSWSFHQTKYSYRKK